ncbi:hypothetical protein ALI144C_24540 [Actinosynnema sp. ALI-1.44]|uniref:helix-turn-helix domain-containing protein n=1 Tax=Actinosynnema sp. ALI-1.44 TaxID=1933779 RepID=UPI00097C3F72|nr:helix-turn-helix domain-containing protein [Actinosynnema sp. ALI-1.44]ONI79900.1 hypothetical protein ALI144C_24540 [Actinosynnema sp. ALI-1.44]
MDDQPEPEIGHRVADDGAGRGVLDGAFLLLEALARFGEAGPTQLAAATGLPKATTHRLLDQLTGLGAVRREAGRYRIGSRMFARRPEGWSALWVRRCSTVDGWSPSRRSCGAPPTWSARI